MACEHPRRGEIDIEIARGVSGVEIANRYLVREVRVQRSHLGIEKMMLDALDAIASGETLRRTVDVSTESIEYI